MAIKHVILRGYNSSTDGVKFLPTRGYGSFSTVQDAASFSGLVRLRPLLDGTVGLREYLSGAAGLEVYSDGQAMTR